METPEIFHAGYCRAGNPQFVPEKRHTDPKSGDHFIIEDLLDFSNEDAVAVVADDDGTFDAAAGNSTDSSTVTAVDSCNSSFSGSELHFSSELGCRNLSDAHFSGDLCVPYDQLVELEWLSNIVDESFSSEDMQKLQIISGMKARTDDSSETREFPTSNGRNSPIFRPEVSVPGKARSKRPRAVPCNWSSRLLVLSPTTSSSESETVAPPNPTKKAPKSTPKKKEAPESSPDGRKCLHCMTDKTPQWRTGPMGPKTLCNACGVRYKSGRLVPEYRPAASPTFMLTKHSNSHRKVMELRRQKELQQQQQQQFLHPNAVFDVIGGDEYLIHHGGPDFRQLI
ncbi:GATA transcription factor 12-like [Magnolia sinica]|uniref:GATA transcription factor 12-like n=1 Tax=Magnolia sinica TaxID=86752 RepID=UPI00265A9122|nr:GATA transcription factor 12-like [Magnolia sinica]XP_058115040.1 GATA transcription factor 12-like [Magnolia sinica]